MHSPNRMTASLMKNIRSCLLAELRKSLDMFMDMMKAYPYLQQITETNQSEIEVKSYRTVGNVGSRTN